MKHINRFILGIGLLSGLLFSGGCRKSSLYDRPFGPEDTALVDAVLILRCNEMQTKATLEEQEQQINDLNLFFVHKSYPSAAAPEVRHYYFSSVDVAKHIKLTNIRLGKYRMYAVANAGEQLCSDSHHPTEPTAVGESFCSMTEDQIKDLVVKFSQNPKIATKFPMTGFNSDMEIPKNDATIQVELKRRVAKYDFTYQLIGPAIGKMAVKKIEIKSVPTRMACFKDNVLADEARLNNWEIFSTANTDGEIFSTPFTECFYLPENKQGIVPGLGMEDRYVQNAPKFATYIYIDGIYDKSQYGMSIYFGDNDDDEPDPENFDINGNAHFVLNIQQGGPNLDDARISSMKLEIQKDFSEANVDEWIGLPVKITCFNYFNDNLALTCNVAYPNLNTVNGEFEVYFKDTYTPVIPNAEGGYNILATGDDGKGSVECIVRYKQTRPYDNVRLALTVNSRLGTTNFEDQQISFKNN